eukprot:GHVQ01006179.1.p1 GENE.GHVQ01006179.1~~GHVQ01006179.1.p1  ORF type:complete len:256 (+),score=61.33 GHVQ01006179.1:889-1656(+)
MFNIINIRKYIIILHHISYCILLLYYVTEASICTHHHTLPPSIPMALSHHTSSLSVLYRSYCQSQHNSLPCPLPQQRRARVGPVLSGFSTGDGGKSSKHIRDATAVEGGVGKVDCRISGCRGENMICTSQHHQSTVFSGASSSAVVFKCGCDRGYRQVGGGCTDKDECVEGLGPMKADPCGGGGVSGDKKCCRNTQGGFECVSKERGDEGGGAVWGGMLRKCPAQSIEFNGGGGGGHGGVEVGGTRRGGGRRWMW